MTGLVTVYSVFANAEEAERVSRAIVEEELAACANILGPCRSIYRWQGAVETATEVPVLFKTRAELADKLVARVAALHSYEVPAAVVWAIPDAHAPYADWILDNTRSA